MKMNVSESNGHPTRKFRNIRISSIPLEIRDEDTELYTFEGFSIKMLKVMDCFKNLYAETVKQVAEHRKNGISEKDMCESNISKTKLIKNKIQMLNLCGIVWDKPENRKMLMGEYIEFAHGVITCAYLGAVSWGEKFGIMLCDGTMPLVPEDEIGVVCRQLAEIARAEIAKSEKKFTNLFTPESIKASEADFDYFIGRMVKDGADHATIERFHEIYYDCKKWATGEHATDRNMNFTFDIKDTTQEEFEDMIEMYYSKARLFCYLLSTYNKGKSITDEGNNDFQRFFNELPSNGFQIIRQLVIDEKKGERVGYIGIYSNEEWNALMNKSIILKPNYIVNAAMINIKIN